MISQDDLNKDINFLANSEIRMTILNELYKEPLNVKELSSKTKIKYSTVSNNVLKLYKLKHIGKNEGKYYLTPLTEFYFKSIIEFKKSIELVNNFHDLWDKHNINELSIDSIKTITCLKDSKLIETTPLDIYKTHNIIKKELYESENIKAIFPYLHPEYPKIIEDVLKRNGKVELIIPKIIYKGIIFEIDKKIRRNAIRKGTLKILSTNKDINLYLTISDKSMSLGLFKYDGSFDQNRILVSKTSKSKEWACDLFEHMKRNVI